MAAKHSFPMHVSGLKTQLIKKRVAERSEAGLSEAKQTRVKFEGMCLRGWGVLYGGEGVWERIFTKGGGNFRGAEQNEELLPCVYVKRSSFVRIVGFVRCFLLSKIEQSR